MRISEVLKKVHELQYLIGQKLPNHNETIYQIIPAPYSSSLDAFFADYLYTGDIDKTIKLHRVSEFEVLLIFKSKTGAFYEYAWFKDYY
jgi:hypothetical protein